ncbi:MULTISPECIES: hypothetical protein [Cereibacter]|uniref:Uncharacterized protein n=1 Tax=Cereibacter johrii TaxID=445629 RepID=A0ABX5J4C0_9RHOB|nr:MULTISPECIES: hypothetical protein [Cereibacter]ODM42838.1 hypothetical protein A9O63_17210 [Cereibacter johrii]PTM77216.1 hypothetical protein C8J29_106142 [Cereibacter johrii]RHZ92340.1 hypothetical protein D1122_20025 [Cereibacter sphaeroides]
MMAVKVAQVTLAKAPWDLGPLTPAQIAGKRIEEVTEIDEKTGKRVNPNGVMRTRRETWIGRYHRQGKLSDEQANIAAELFEASAGNPARDPLAALVRVDASGERDREAERVDRRRKFFAMWEEVPAFARPVIQHVVLDDRSLRSMPGRVDSRSEARQLDRLQRGLEALCEAWR